MSTVTQTENYFDGHVLTVQPWITYCNPIIELIDILFLKMERH